MDRFHASNLTDGQWFTPRLAIKKESATASGSTTATGYTATAVTTPLTYSTWKGTTMPAGIELTFSSTSIDYMACYINDAGSGVTVTPQYWDGAAWQSFGSATSISVGPMMWAKTSGVTTTKTKLLISGTTCPTISVFNSGKLIEIPSGMPDGFESAAINPEEDFFNTFSEGGQVLSSILKKSTVSQKVQCRAIDSSWYSTWEEIRPLMNTNGMFFAWNPKDKPKEVIYGMRGKTSPVIKYENGLFLNISFDIEGPKVDL